MLDCFFWWDFSSESARWKIYIFWTSLVKGVSLEIEYFGGFLRYLTEELCFKRELISSCFVPNCSIFCFILSSSAMRLRAVFNKVEVLSFWLLVSPSSLDLIASYLQLSMKRRQFTYSTENYSASAWILVPCVWFPLPSNYFRWSASIAYPHSKTQLSGWILVKLWQQLFFARWFFVSSHLGSFESSFSIPSL